MNLYKHFIIKPFLFLIGDRRLTYFKYLKKNLSQDFEVLQEWQFTKIIELLKYSYSNVPFYKYWFDRHNVDVDSISSLSDFSEKVPVLTKKDIIENLDKFKKNNTGRNRFVASSTGGSTGQPLKYRMSVEDHQMGVAMLLRGMSYGGYELGDKLLVLAGGSLVKESNGWKTKIVNKVFRQYKVSSYGLSDEDLESVVKLIKKEKIKYLRGYASSIFLLAEYCKNNSICVSFNAVFSTSERLLDNQRLAIESMFGCMVYDQYGLNDGGISAYQYNDNKGYLVDVERSYFEIERSSNLKNGQDAEGRILATSFLNIEFPFIRYDTGDIGEVTYDFIKDFPYRARLKKLLGRETEYLIINNKKIGSPVLTVLMGRTNVEQYKIIQKGENFIEVHLKKAKDYSIKDELFIRKSFFDKCGQFNLEFKYVDDFRNENKHKFIIREWDEKES